VVVPSGEQTEIRHGAQSAVVVGVGGGLRSYRIEDRPVLDGYDVDASCDGARCQTLAPWPNRVQDGRWSWRGVDHQLALTEPEQHNAIHGLVRWMPWSVVDHSASRATVACVLYPQPGYPWTIEIRNAWSVGDDGLEVQTSVENLSDTAAPFAVGFHPYLTLAAPAIDDVVLTLPASTRLLTGAQQIPNGTEAVDGTPYDFREPRRLGDLQMDSSFTDLSRDADGRCRVVLADPHRDLAVTLWSDEAYPYFELFTGDSLPDAARRRQGLAVEPMSAPPNALASGESIDVVEPGATWTGRWGISPSFVGGAVPG
jgi:aldose 1-epimerase